MKKEILKILSITTLIGILFLNFPVYANVDTTVPTTDETQVEENTIDTTTDTETTTDATEDDPGMKPDSMFYILDRLFEKIQITFSFDDIKKANILASISEERMAEANYLLEKAEGGELDEEKWNELLVDVINDYKEKIVSSLEMAEEISINLDENDQAKFDEILAKLEASTKVNEEIVNEDVDLKEKIDSALLVANVISGLDKEKVAELREQGLGFGQISQVFALAEATDKDVKEIASLFIDGEKGFGAVSKELGINPSDLAKKKVEEKNKNKALEKSNKAAEKAESALNKAAKKAEGDLNKANEKAENALNKLAEKQRQDRVKTEDKDHDDENENDEELEQETDDEDKEENVVKEKQENGSNKKSEGKSKK